MMERRHLRAGISMPRCPRLCRQKKLRRSVGARSIPRREAFARPSIRKLPAPDAGEAPRPAQRRRREGSAATEPSGFSYHRRTHREAP